MPAGRPLKSVRETTLRCSCCTRWLKDEKFPSNNTAMYKHRRNRGGYCRECASLFNQYRWMHRKVAS
jgi:hypothetical protein